MDEISKQFSLMGKLMDAAAQRTRVTANNLANVNTPGFTRSRVVFEEELAEALRERTGWRGTVDHAPRGRGSRG